MRVEAAVGQPGLAHEFGDSDIEPTAPQRRRRALDNTPPRAGLVLSRVAHGEGILHDGHHVTQAGGGAARASDVIDEGRTHPAEKSRSRVTTTKPRARAHAVMRASVAVASPAALQWTTSKPSPPGT